EFKPVRVDPLVFQDLAKHPDLADAVQDPTDAIKRLESVSSSARKKLIDGLAPGKGKGGTGRGGGEGTGVGPGKGADKGPGEGKVKSQRVKRALRWTMVFNTASGQDYRKQLADLSAGMTEKTIIAVPQPDGQYLIFRDLNRVPPAGRIEDIAEIKRIYWVDADPQSIRSLSGALGVPTPPHIVVFFPVELEEKLLRLELDYAKRKYGETAEDQIQETRFEIVRRGGVY